MHLKKDERRAKDFRQGWENSIKETFPLNFALRRQKEFNITVKYYRQLSSRHLVLVVHLCHPHISSKSTSYKYFEFTTLTIKGLWLHKLWCLYFWLTPRAMNFVISTEKRLDKCICGLKLVTCFF